MTKSIFQLQAALILILFFIGVNQKANSQTKANQDPKTKLIGNYVGSSYKGNFVWCGAMNLAWNELNQNVLKEKLQLKSKDKFALEIATSFNKSTFTNNDLDENSYYEKSGFGQKTVDAINEETKPR